MGLSQPFRDAMTRHIFVHAPAARLMPMRTPADVEAVLETLPVARILARCRFEAAEAQLMGPQRP